MSTQIYGKRHKEGREIRQLEPSHEEIVSLISALLALWSFERFLRKESQLGMPQPAAALSITNMVNPHLFFFALSISSLLARLPCLAVSLSACPHVPAKELFIILVSVDLC